MRDAVKMATINPAKRIGVSDRKGSLEVGKDADITIVDDQLNVYTTMVRGRAVHQV
ncbi:MAG: amidohydrolase family protein [Candidatus Bathyarchaeota archaeon]|nr:amidohydrolase family protein [Candidatus Bathyarchaeota archaeon]